RAGRVVTARLDRTDHGPTLRDLLSRTSLDCPRDPISCGHMLADHGDGWDDQGRPTNPTCRVTGCDCDGIR
ncbi:MAG: hypothetical protein L0I24_16695, partial [Pseudonocardia sp.]|nr:hypothetical protein [Pseudonocardia sp.]